MFLTLIKRIEITGQENIYYELIFPTKANLISFSINQFKFTDKSKLTLEVYDITISK